MATLYLKTAGGNWSAAGTWSNVNAGGVDNSGPPTAADNAIAELLSGNLTVDGTSGSPNLARSFDTTSGTSSWGGTLTMGATAVLNIGDATAGAGNVALKLNSGITSAPNAASTINFISSSGTQQTVDSGGKTLGLVVFNGAGSNYALVTNLTTGAALTLTQGAFHTDGTADNSGLSHSWVNFNANNANTRTLALGNSSIALTISTNNTFWNSGNVTGLTVSANTATITATGSNSNGITFLSVSKNWNGMSLSASGSGVLIMDAGGSTFANFTKTSTAAKTNALQLNSNFTVTNSLTINGDSAINRIFTRSNVIGTSRTITVTGATVSTTNTDYRDILFANGGSNLDLTNGGTTSVGNAGGNAMSGGGTLTFTTPATQTATGTASFTWSTHGWTSRVPLPQDDVVINNVFVSGRTITADMPRLGKTIDMSGATWAGTAPTFNNNVANIIFGSLKFASGMLWSGNTGLSFQGRSTYNLQSGGISIATGTSLDAPGGTLTLSDALSSTFVFTVSSGTLDAGGFNVTFLGLTAASGTTINMGAGTWTLTTTGTVWNINSVATINASTSTVVINNASSTSKTFGGGGKTYNNLRLETASTAVHSVTGNNTFNQLYRTGAGSGNWTITGSNTIADFKDDGSVAHSIIFTAATTQSIAAWNASGTAGQVITLDSSSTATYALTKTGVGTVSADYLNIQHSVARPWSGAGGADTWYAGTNSTDNQATVTAGSGWIFTAPPNTNTSSMFFGFF